MRNIEDDISIFVKGQFPSFYEEEGPNFIEFAKEYYKYLESSNNALYYSRNLLEYRDIDKTIDEFTVHFKEKYLKNFPFNLAASDSRFLVKHIMDFYRSKGSERSYKIFFQSAHDTTVNFYYPKEDIFKLSDGTWVKPVYLELYDAPNLLELINKEAKGSYTGATAFVENIVARRINGRQVVVAYLSNVKGNFQAGEVLVVSSSGTTTGYPVIAGSISSVDIITGGQNFAIGDTLIATTGGGKQAKFRVSSIASETGVVTFTLEEGGFGYSGGFGFTSNAEVLISTKVLDLGSSANNINIFETVKQPLANIGFISANGTFAAGDVIQGWFANNTLAGNAVILSIVYTTTNTGTIFASTVSGNVANGASGVIRKSGNTLQAVVNTYADVSATGNVMGQNATSIGVINVTNVFTDLDGNYIYSTGISAVNTFVDSVGVGSGANFKIGSITNPETVRIDTTFLKDNNYGNISFMDILLDGSNANVYSNSGPYGFPKNTGVSLTAGTLLDALDIQDYQIGTVYSLAAQDGGQNYTKAPFVRIFEDTTSAYRKYDYILSLTNATRNFATGELVTQTSSDQAVLLTVNNFTGNSSLSVGEFVYQSNGTSNIATGFVYSSSVSNTGNGNGSITLISTTGSFVVNATATGNYQIKALTSQANAKVVAANNSYGITVTGKGIVKVGSNTEVLLVKRLSFADTFATGNTITGSDSGASATIARVQEDRDSLLNIGNNAVVTANVAVANGTVTGVSIISSGFGYVDNETINMVNAANNTQGLSGKLHTQTQGVGEGFYSSNKGFLSSDKYIHDGEYYQNFSYVLQSKVPFDLYTDVLKKIVHVAGTKMFGEYVSEDEIAATIITANTAEITTT
jgi:hypothetical protein